MGNNALDRWLYFFLSNFNLLKLAWTSSLKLLGEMTGSCAHLQHSKTLLAFQRYIEFPPGVYDTRKIKINKKNRNSKFDKIDGVVKNSILTLQ